VSSALQTLITFLVVGCLYALIALGYTLVYGILRFINFAHSDIVTWGAWICFTVASFAGWLGSGGAPWFGVPLVLFAAMGICATMGVTIELLAYRPLRNAPRLNVLITAIGVSLFLENVGQIDWTFGSRPKSIGPLMSNPVLFSVGEASLRMTDLLTVVLAVVLVLGLELLIHTTRLGRAMRAVSFDERVASLMGVNVNVVVSATFAIGSALAAAGGLLFALRNDLRQTADSSWVLLGLKAFVSAVVGGIGSVRGAAAGALLIAFVEVVVTRVLSKVFPSAPWVVQLQDVYVFGILILVLLFKPSGLFGSSAVEKV
jgi:branched-chain amino acid transport system permease protein